MNIRPTAWMLYALLSIVAVPVLVFIAGRLLAGPYEGKFGLLGLMGNIYKDAITGHAGAWFILLAPLLIIAIWWGSFALCRNRATEPTPSTSRRADASSRRRYGQ